MLSDEAKKSKVNTKIFWFFFTLIFSSICLYAIFIHDPAETKNEYSTSFSHEDRYRLSALIAAEQIMSQRLNAPSTAKFQPKREAKYRIDNSTGEEFHVVTSYVDSQNSFGAMLRTNFILVMKTTGTDWHLEEIFTW